MNLEILNSGVFTPLAGGLLIGTSAILMMLLNGRVVGISGIFYQLTTPSKKPVWQLGFILGLLTSAFMYYRITGQAYPEMIRPWQFAIVGGIFVGVGTRLGSGCTSGHGVCGISRFSPRSLIATITFIGTGIITASLVSFL
ncbi:MAG: YeeE/YedE [Gammaproteobacteria bacterium]|nr:MAG: YeeE/YedE [Gammaproteobacteria bacterium]